MIEYTYARDGKTCLCCFHPKEVVVGVCALCLNERLLVLASKQEKMNKFMKNTTNEYYRSFLMSKKKNINDGHDHHHHQGVLEHNNNNNNNNNNQYPRIHLPKMFALSSLLSRLDISHGRKVEEVHDIADDDASSCSHEESFISIKFENNGVGSWEKKGVTSAVPKVSLNNKHCDMSWSKDGNGGAKVAVIEHVKPRLPLRWRKRIGHIFQVIKLKRSTKGSSSSSVCHVGTKLEGVKVRHGHGHSWIRTLTKRKTKD